MAQKQKRMLKPTLPFAPHELAPQRRAELDGKPFVFCALWAGRAREFVGQVVGQSYAQMIFFALANEPERGHFVNAPVWVSKNPDSPASPVWEPRTYLHPDSARQILELSANQGWGRLYFLDENLEVARGEAARWRLFLARSGWGQWCAAPDFYMEQARFRWHPNAVQARRLALMSPLELLDQTRASLLEAQSDAALARQFAPLSVTARHWLCRPVGRGSYEEWRQVLGWYLQSYFPNQAAEKARLKVAIHESRADSTDKWLVGGPFSCFSPGAARFVEWTRQHFAPQNDEDFLRRCSAAADWSKRTFALGVSALRPTQHQRLEALLQLRDWLKDKAAPAEVEALLRAE